jgi:hypothetical protein
MRNTTFALCTLLPFAVCEIQRVAAVVDPCHVYIRHITE